MRNFQFRDFAFICESKSNRSGFCHSVILFYKGTDLTKAKVQYYNRTWGNYPFRMAILKAIDVAIKERENLVKEMVMDSLEVDGLRSKKAKELYVSYCSSNFLLNELKDTRYYFANLYS